ncbi:TraB/GumN family protein [Ornithinibacillus salinisoli]|uniref:TraB/GumN family protein n=1 Tax=Ornithinibacillus salinisoli TaxID=1848459 RepID=A0ABW4VW14_9BACI
MKRSICNIIILVLAVFLFACQSEDISFTDEKLEAAIRAEIDKSEGQLSDEDLDGITELDLSDQEIEELNGIEKLDELEVLFLQNNNIRDFSVLEKLDSLKEVTIAGNPFDQDSDVFVHLADQDIEVITTLEVEVVGTPDGPGGFLWKVENGTTTVYLQGTIHAATEDFYPLNEKIEQAYAESDIIVPEIDLNNVNPFEVQGITTELAAYQDGTTLQDHIPEELFTELEATLHGLGMPIQMLQNFKPWFLSSTIQQLMIEQLGYTHGVDEYFLNRADQDNKQVIGLETVEEQLSIYADTSHAYQVQMLEDSLIDIEEFDQHLQEMFSLYKEGNSDKLLASLTDENMVASAEDQAFMEALNDNRNYGMADTIKEFLEKDSGDTYFVIVGSLHLLLEPHIVSILEEEGFEVERVH